MRDETIQLEKIAFRREPELRSAGKTLSAGLGRDSDILRAAVTAAAAFAPIFECAPERGENHVGRGRP